MKLNFRKISGIAMIFATGTLFFGCNGSKNWNKKNSISVISREDGSGTRGAFIELFGIEKKDAGGKKIDYTTDDSAITNSTAVMMTTVSQDKYAIGYISLGSLNDSVKALKVDGAEASVFNIKTGAYKIARPFNVAVKENLSELARDFLDYILSDKGQAVIEANKYIKVFDDDSDVLSAADVVAAGAVDDKSTGKAGTDVRGTVKTGGDFISSGADGKIVISGSSSVSPVMEKLIESYKAENPNAKIELQTSDSTTGITNVINGNCDIGIASRALKDSETAKGVKEITIALDGIAVIVNNENPLEDISKQQVEQIFTGSTTKWQSLM